MAVTDPSAGRAMVWIISSILCFCIFAGGGCLVVYVTLPESQTGTSLPIIGVTLVCLPWFFWFMTFCYRCARRFCCPRSDGGAGGGAGGPFANSVRLGDAESVAESNRGGGSARAGSSRGFPATGKNGGNNGVQPVSRSSSIASHESELPLAISMDRN